MSSSLKQSGDRPHPTGFDHGDPELVPCMHEVLAELRSQCPVGWSDNYGGFWTLTRYHDVVDAARDHSAFTTTQGIMIPPTGASMRLVPAEFDPPEHSAYRKMVMPFFTKTAIAENHNAIRRLVRECFDTFSLERPRSPSDVTFGTGRHRCLGEHLAVAELSAVVDELLSRLPDARIAPDAEIRWTGGGNTRGVESLPIVFTPEKTTQ